MPTTPAALALSPGEVSLSSCFGCLANAGGLALPGSGVSELKEGWHLGLQTQACALASESKGESSHLSLQAGTKEGAQRRCGSLGGSECLSKLQGSDLALYHYCR